MNLQGQYLRAVVRYAGPYEWGPRAYVLRLSCSDWAQ